MLALVICCKLISKLIINSMANHLALVLVEGETEVQFYERLCNEKLNGIPKRIKNLKGNYNINTKILDRATEFHRNHPDCTFDVYVCVDQEKVGVPPFNRQFVEEKLKSIEKLKRITPVIAVIMLESLFFIDISGIYKFIRAKKSKRNKKKYSNFRKLSHRELSRLFKQFGKYYNKGIRCEGLVNALNLNLIISKAAELSKFIDNVRERTDG